MKNLILVCSVLISVFGYSQCEDFGQDITFNGVTCFGFSDGSVTTNVFGEEGDLIIVITDSDDIVVNVDNSNTANTLEEGWHYIFVVDEETGCELFDSTYVGSPGEIDIDLRVMTSNSEPDCDGYAVVDTVYNYGGDYNYISYFWNPDPTGVSGLWADSCYALCPQDSCTVLINDENGCSKVFYFDLGDFAGIQDFSEATIDVIPKPFTGEVTVQMNTYTLPLRIDLYESSGKLVYSGMLNQEITFFNPNLNTGAYIYTIRDSEQIIAKGKFAMVK